MNPWLPGQVINQPGFHRGETDSLTDWPSLLQAESSEQSTEAVCGGVGRLASAGSSGGERDETAGESGSGDGRVPEPPGLLRRERQQ